MPRGVGFGWGVVAFLSFFDMKIARFPAYFGGNSDKTRAKSAGVSRVRSVPGRIHPGGRAKSLKTCAICLLNPGVVSWFLVSFFAGNLGRRAGIRPGVWVLRASVNKSSNKEKRTRPAKIDLRPFSDCARFACFRGRGWAYIIGLVVGFGFSLCAVVGALFGLLRKGTKKPATKGGPLVSWAVVTPHPLRAGISV